MVRVFYRREFVTVYGFLEERYGNATRVTASILFLCGRVVASAVRLFAGCIAIHVSTGIPLESTVVGLGLFGAIYTLWGGIRAVVWTDVLLGVTFIVGGVITVFYLLAEIPGGLTAVLSNPGLAEKTAILNFGTSLSQSNTFLAGLAGGFVLTLATHGTDQDIAQRMLTCRDSKNGSLSVLGSAALIVPLMALFLAIGTLLHFFYEGRQVPQDANHIFPVFIANELPHGFSGLVMAGLFAAAISSYTSVLNALAATSVSDFYTPLRACLGRIPDDQHLVRFSRGVTLFWGATLVLLALAFEGSSGNILNVALSVLTYFYGGLLGVFLLGIFTRRGSNLSVITGMIVSVPAVLSLQLRQYLQAPQTVPSGARLLIGRLPEEFCDAVLQHVPVVAWPYWIIIGTTITFAIGFLGSRGPVVK
jgi:SSS family solute:Na+ symporter